MAVPLARALGTTTDELLRFGERYQEFEQLWMRTQEETRMDEKALLEVALAALKEFPHDRNFLFRAAVGQMILAIRSEDDDESRDYIGQALANAAFYVEMSAGEEAAIKQSARNFYKRMKDRCQVVNGFYELKPEFCGPDVQIVI